MIKKVIGLMFIIFGILLLFSNLDIISIKNMTGIFFSLAVVVIGLVGMIERKKFDLFLATISIIGGLYFTANMGYIETSLVSDLVFPIILIAIGFSLILNFTKKIISTKSVTTYIALFGGVEDKNESPEYLSSEITAIFGGAEIDYRKIKFKEDKAYIDATAIFGGATIILPEDVRVTVRGLPIFGGADNKAVSKPDTKKEMIITYTAIFGGIEIKN